MDKKEFTEAFKAECGRPWFKKMLANQIAAGSKQTKETATEKKPGKETATTGK